MATKKQSQRNILQIKVTLRGTRPPIWRRLQLLDTTTLADLHAILQTAMGWTDSHLHQFRIGDLVYAPSDQETWTSHENEKKTRVGEVLRRPKTKMIYEYDFGDGWEHEIVLEKVLPRQSGEKYPIVVAGKRACPPEDVGGIWGFYEFLEAMSDPHHPKHEWLHEWYGGDYDPEDFDVNEVNVRFHGGWSRN